MLIIACVVEKQSSGRIICCWVRGQLDISGCFKSTSGSTVYREKTISIVLLLQMYRLSLEFEVNMGPDGELLLLYLHSFIAGPVYDETPALIVTCWLCDKGPKLHKMSVYYCSNIRLQWKYSLQTGIN